MTNAKDSSGQSYVLETARHFLDRETTGGLLLILGTVGAIVIANTDLAPAYHAFLEDEFVIGLQDFLELKLSLEVWINDGLMVIFFLVAGLEIKREVLVGELSSFKKAAMPILAALGGMLFPAAIFALFNFNTDTVHGWGIPMATDIAYCLGIMGLLGKRVPAQLKVFLVSLAIADDLGAILIIAFFYSSEIAWMRLIIAGGLLLILILLNFRGVKHLWLYVVIGLGFWLCFIHSGIHPTIAGVLFAITIPVKPKMQGTQLRDKVNRHIANLEATNIDDFDPVADKRQHESLKELRRDAKQSQPILLRLENSLTGFNSYVIIPVFALANAGVKLDVGIGEVMTHHLGLGIIVGLVLGKAVGISLFSFISKKTGLASISDELSWGHIIGAGFLAGIGFTMSLFITNLAMEDQQMIQIAKISIMLASVIAVLIGGILLVALGQKAAKS